MTVYFYAQTDRYAAFSNFALYGERIRAASKPKDAKALGMKRTLPLRADWGCGPDGQGLNTLGKLLMETRETLRASA